MSFPDNPNTVVIRNQFYKNGLREIDIWNYYQKVKPLILKETRNRDVMFEIMVDINKSIIKRKASSGKYIRLTPQNYDTIITGRTVSIHAAMGSYENFGVIDIDISPGDGFIWAKKTTLDVYEFVMDKIPIVTSAFIKFTGKTSFHIVCKFRRKIKIDSIRYLLRKFLRQSDLAKIYTIEAKRRPGVPNLDLAPNKYRGNFIVLNSLSILGLKCMEVPYTSLMQFQPINAKLKRR